MPFALLIVDDHVAIAQALAGAFEDAGVDPVAYVGLDELDLGGILAAARRVNPTIALVDLDLGFGRSGLSVMGPLVGAGVKVVAFTARDDELAVAESVAAGAVGFLTKIEPFESIMRYLTRVANGDDVLGRPRRDELMALARSARAAGDERLARFATLTRREREVLGALMAGSSAKQIAGAKGVTVKTVRTQIEAVRSKLGVRSQLAAVALAQETGWRYEPGDRRG